MSKASKAWDSLGIQNPYALAIEARRQGLPDVYITYRPASGHFRPSAWQVIRPGFQTDSQAHWTDSGNKTFDLFRATRAEALAAAQEWATERYQVTSWEKVPGMLGAYFPAEVAAWAKTVLKGASKS